MDLNETGCSNLNLKIANETEHPYNFTNKSNTNFTNPDDEFIVPVRDFLEGVLIPLVGSCGVIGEMYYITITKVYYY